MKTLKKTLVIAMTIFALCPLCGQSGIHSSYRNAIGSNGNVYFSVGQAEVNGSYAKISEGVQKAFEIYTVGMGEGGIEIDVEIHPNPSSGILTLTSSEAVSREMSYIVYDQIGNLIESKEFISQKTQIDLSTFETGLYFIHVSNDVMGEEIFKVIKRH